MSLELTLRIISRLRNFLQTLLNYQDSCGNLCPNMQKETEKLPPSKSTQNLNRNQKLHITLRARYDSVLYTSYILTQFILTTTS